MAAVRPDFVIADLEKEFARNGDTRVVRKPLPMARLCAQRGRVWSFELWGRGELMRGTGGGRVVREVRCK